MHRIPYIIFIALTTGLLIACGQKTFDVPSTYEEKKEQAQQAN